MKYTCSIIIYNYESLPFLKTCVRQIRRYAHEDIAQEIIISEQSSEESYNEVIKEFGNDEDIRIVRMQSICSGYAIDYIMRNVEIKSEYICTLDVDAVPINKNWVYTSIKLLEEENFSFVGVHADIEKAYSDFGIFFCMAQYFRVGRTKDYKELSLNAGFTRYTHRPQITEPIEFKNNDWGNYATKSNENGWSDSGVTAHWWGDRYLQNNKFTFAVTHCIGEHGSEPLYGRITDGIVFHFSFSFTSIGSESKMGNKYLDWYRRINENFSDELIEEMLASAKPMLHPISRELWDGANKKIIEVPDELNFKIEKLKHDLAND